MNIKKNSGFKYLDFSTERFTEVDVCGQSEVAGDEERVRPNTQGVDVGKVGGGSA